jgi:hypothetical protein
MNGVNDMKRCCAIPVILVGLCLGTPARAAPPTVTPSPGYDARLQEQRAAAARIDQQPAPPPVYRHRVRRHHHDAH